MSEEIERLHFRKSIPEAHRGSLDTRVQWLWNQRSGTVQTIWRDSPDMLDRTAATLILQSIIGHDLESIALLFRRLEGGALEDEAVREQETLRV